MHVISTNPRRALPLGIAAVVAALALLAALSLSGGGTPAARADTGSMSLTAPVTQNELALSNAMRKLWEDHITWTRMVIVDFAAGLPDLTFAEKRLLPKSDRHRQRDQAVLRSRRRERADEAPAHAHPRGGLRCSRTRSRVTRRSSGRRSRPGTRTAARSRRS